MLTILTFATQSDPNRAPVWVFLLLGAVIAVAAAVLYFTTYTGGEHDYWYADPSNNYFGSPGGPEGIGRFGGVGLGGFGGFGGH